jgi:hypothetical protein
MAIVASMPPGPPAMPPPPSAVPAMADGPTPPPRAASSRPSYGSRRDPQLEYVQQAYPAPSLPKLGFKRNGMLLLAQFLAIVQGVLAVVAAIQLLSASSGSNSLAPGFAITAFFGGVLVTWGVEILVVGVLVITFALRAGRPSQVARWILAGWEIIAFLTFLPLVTGSGLGFGFNFSPVIVIGAADLANFVPAWVMLAVQGLIIYGLVIHPPTHRAFAARKPQPAG